jgi:hypothetical protein
MDDPTGVGRWAAELTVVELEAGLRDLGHALAIPPSGADGAVLDPAARARARIVAGGDRRRRVWSWWRPRAGGRLRRATILAVIAVLVVAAIVGAIGLGLPGIRIVPGSIPSATLRATPSTIASPSPSLSPSPSPSVEGSFGGPLGSGLGLGDPIALGDAGRAADITVMLPSSTGLGSPASAWIMDGRLTLVWPTGPALPSTREAGVGLILSEFRGSIDPGYFQKTLDAGTTIVPVEVNGVTGYWISGTPHVIVFIDAHGSPVFDSRRIVGDTLLWARGDRTYRLESGLDRAAAIALAATLR